MAARNRPGVAIQQHCEHRTGCDPNVARAELKLAQVAPATTIYRRTPPIGRRCDETPRPGNSLRVDRVWLEIRQVALTEAIVGACHRLATAAQ